MGENGWPSDSVLGRRISERAHVLGAKVFRNHTIMTKNWAVLLAASRQRLGIPDNATYTEGGG